MSTIGPFLTGFNIKIRKHLFIVTHAAPPLDTNLKIF
jgi:hypothetical protein